MRPVFSLLLALAATVAAAAAHGATYYISAQGDDGHDGRTPARAIRTLGRLNALELRGGDSVLFVRGGEWHGTLFLRSGESGHPVHYGAWGEGAAPILSGSVEASDAGMWSLRDWLWEYGAELPLEVGNIIADGRVGRLRWERGECSEPLDFHYDAATRRLSVAADGNPALLWRRIDLALNRTVVIGYRVHDVTVCDLAIRYGGAHGIQLDGCSRVDIARNEISWVGGGSCPGMERVRYGNGVELWGANDHIVVRDNHIHDIYDTGVTNQSHSAAARQEHITYRGNLIESCAMFSFELWNNGLEGSAIRDVSFVGNICIDAGGGWGRQRPDTVGYHVNWGVVRGEAESIVIADNLFVDGRGFVLGALDGDAVPSWYAAITVRGNRYSVTEAARHNACYLFCNYSDTTVAFGLDQREECEAFCGVRLGVEGRVREE